MNLRSNFISHLRGSIWLGDYVVIINYLITESEVVTGKSQTEALPYWPSDSEVNTVGRGLRFSRNDRTVEVIKLFIIWLTKRI